MDKTYLRNLRQNLRVELIDALASNDQDWINDCQDALRQVNEKLEKVSSNG